MFCPSDKLRPIILLNQDGNPPGEPDHNIAYSHDAIFVCGECGGGFAERRRHDSFDFESVFDQNDQYALDPESIGELGKALAICPNRLARECTCAVHQSLRASWPVLPELGSGNDVIDIPRIYVMMAGDLPALQVRNGRWTAYYRNGKRKAEGELKAGKLTGNWIFWHQNGKKKAEGAYANDMRQGKWTELNEQGQVNPNQRNQQNDFEICEAL